MEREQLLDVLQDYFLTKEDVSTVYLFGSFAQGRARVSSDVDIAILFVCGVDPYDALIRQLDFANDLEELLRRPVDVVNMETAKPIFVHQVLLTKEIVLDRDIERRVQFEVNHRREYFDLLPYYRTYHEQALKRLGEDS